MKHLPSFLAATVRLTVAHGANATGFLLGEQSSLANGRAYAGAGVVGDDLSAVYFNPAAMTLLSGTRAQTGFMVIGTGFKFKSDDGLTHENGRNKEAAVPSTYFTHQISNDLWVGLGITTPYGLSTNYQRDWAYASRGDYAKIISFDINPNIAWKLSDQLSIAAGVSAQYAKAKLGMRMDTAESHKTGLHGFMNADSWQFGYNFGLLYKPVDTLRLGLAYRSQMSHSAKGDYTVKGKFNSLVDITEFTASTRAHLKTPATAIFSSAWEFAPKWTFSSIVRWSKWSNLKNISIKSNQSTVHKNLNAIGSNSTVGAVAAYQAITGTPPSDSSLIMPTIQAAATNIAQAKLGDQWTTLTPEQKGIYVQQAAQTVIAQGAQGAQNQVAEGVSDITINANFQDTWLFGFGLDYELSDDWTIRGGICYETNPVKHQQDRLAVLPDSERIWYTIGASYKPTKNIQIDGSLCYLKALGTGELYDYQGGKRVGKYSSHSKFAGVQIQYLF